MTSDLLFATERARLGSGRSILVVVLATVLLVAWAGTGRADDRRPSGLFPHVDVGMHTAHIYRMDVDAAERFLVTASRDMTARVWSLADGRLLRTFRLAAGPGNGDGRFPGAVFSAAIHPDGSEVAVAGVGRASEVVIFDRESGAVRHRSELLPAHVIHLAYAPDGGLLVAALFDRNNESLGIRVYVTESFTLFARDEDYDGPAGWAAFAADGRLATSSFDGRIRVYDADTLALLRAVETEGLRLPFGLAVLPGGRLRSYDPDLQPLHEAPAPGGERPLGVAFSPDGRAIAVGYRDAARIDVLGSETLAPQSHAVVARPGRLVALPGVAWSPDGRFLWAGAVGDATGPELFRWSVAEDLSAPVEIDLIRTGGSTMDIPVAFDLQVLRSGAAVVGLAEWRFGLFEADGTAVWAHERQLADFRRQVFDRSIRVSADASVVRFGFEANGGRPAQFRVRDGVLETGALTPVDLALPDSDVPGFSLQDWIYRLNPDIAGTDLGLFRGELVLSMSTIPTWNHFALGTQWAIYVFDSSGGFQRWRQIPGAVWSLNASSDGRFVVAAHGNGTIRWYDTATWAERLVLFPHTDGERWVAWTPEGFYAASPGGEDLIVYPVAVSRGEIPLQVTGGQVRDVFHRPDLVARTLDADRSALTDALADLGDLHALMTAAAQTP